MRYWGDVRIREHLLLDTLRPVDFRTDVLPINPGQKIPVVWETNEPLTAPELLTVQNDTRRIYGYGAIEYFDVFGRTRTATFRFEYGGARLIGMGEMIVSQEGNEPN